MPEFKYFLEGKQTSLPEMYELINAEAERGEIDIVSTSGFFRRVQMSGIKHFTMESLRQILNKNYKFFASKEFYFNGKLTPIKVIYEKFVEEFKKVKKPYCSYPTFHRKIYSSESRNLTIKDSYLITPNYNKRNKIPKKGIREKEATTAQGIKFWCDTAKLW